MLRVGFGSCGCPICDLLVAALVAAFMMCEILGTPNWPIFQNQHNHWHKTQSSSAPWMYCEFHDFRLSFPLWECQSRLLQGNFPSSHNVHTLIIPLWSRCFELYMLGIVAKYGTRPIICVSDFQMFGCRFHRGAFLDSDAPMLEIDATIPPQRIEKLSDQQTESQPLQTGWWGLFMHPQIRPSLAQLGDSLQDLRLLPTTFSSSFGFTTCPCISVVGSEGKTHLVDPKISPEEVTSWILWIWDG